VKRMLFILCGALCCLPLITVIAKRTRIQEPDIVIAKEAIKPVRLADIPIGGSIVPGFSEKAFTEKRKVATKNLVKKATDFLEKNNEAKSFNAFTYSDDFVRGELYIFVYNLDGVCLAIGKHRDLLWQNLYDRRDSYGTYIIRNILEKAKKGGGWVTYGWQNAIKVSYVQQVKKGGKTYVVGCGFYPHSKRDAVVGLVNGAVSYFNDVVARGGTLDEAFGRFNYPLGSFVFGDLYLFALDFKGNIMAQGDRPGLVGQNTLNYQDEEGKFVNKEIMKKLEKSDNGIWVDYISKRAPKTTYAREVRDKKGRRYFIACGYYPTAGRRAVVDLVRKGFRYMEGHGVSQAVESFSAKRITDFRFGDIFLFVYDMKGNVIADGSNEDFIGTNQFNLTDDSGRYYVQEMIQKAQDGGGWLDYKVRNASRYVYVEEIEIGKRKFVIGAGLHPISKPEVMQLLVKSAVSLMDDTSREEALEAFVKKGGEFIKGDLSIFVFGADGTCYAYGQDFNRIWRNMSKAKDDDGKFFVQTFVKTAKDGPAAITYRRGGATQVAYVEMLEKNGMSYVIGSSFFK